MSAPGWFPDPVDPSRQRFFDGNVWTENYAPVLPPPPAVPAKTGMSRGRKIGLVAAAAVAAVVVLGNTGDRDERTSSAVSSEASPSTLPAAQVESGPAPAGSTVRDGKFEFQVLGVERGATSIDDVFGPEVAIGEFFTVKLRVTNIGDEARSFSATSQHLIIDGNRYDATSLLSSDWREDINPGLSIDTEATFDIPRGAAPSAIECHDSSLSQGTLLAL